MRKSLYVLLLLAVPWLGGCTDPLDVKNYNNPNRDDVLATPADLENWVIGTFNTWFRAWTRDNGRPQLFSMGLENHSELMNFNMGPRYLIPRNLFENTRGAQGTAETNADFLAISRAARSAALGISKLDEGVSIGSVGEDARARAFAYFVLGLANGYLSFIWDSSTAVAPDDDPEVAPELVPYSVVNAAAIANLTAAETAVNDNLGTFTIPAAWLRQSSDMSQADFLRLIRSYRAQIRAGVARTPAERAAVDWAAVAADASNGITADFEINCDPSANFDVSFTRNNNFRAGSWHAMHLFMLGMADTTGIYQTWLNTRRADKVQFSIQTPDLRFPRGATRADQQSGTAVLPAGQYFRNRPPGDDTAGDPLGNSPYDHYRFRALYDANFVGPFPTLTKAEVDLLAAEAYIRTNQWGLAMGKINPSRVAAGLPQLAGISSLNDPVPGGLGCVPRVPVYSGGSYQAVCGNILEAMKWEKRLETAYTGWGNWFVDSRGWGDLPEGTPLNWPVPWDEKDSRRAAFTTSVGGCGRLGTPESAGASTYGPSLSCNPAP